MYAYLFLNNISQLHVHKQNTRSLQLCKSSFNKIFHHFETVQNEENIWKKPHIHIGKSKVQKLFCLHRFACGKGLEYSDKLFLVPHSDPSSETQGQIVGEGKSKWAEKYGTKKSKEQREEPLGTMSYQTSSKRSPPFCLLIGARKLCVFLPNQKAE